MGESSSCRARCELLLGLNVLELLQDTYVPSLHNMVTPFLDLPVEIRLKIYSELLVLARPIVFVAECGHRSPTLPRGDELCPALLRVNRKVYCEAVPLLYSENRFQFPGVALPTTGYAYMSTFFKQVGSQAGHMQHVLIPFPFVSCYHLECTSLHEAHLESLELIRDTCTSLRTLELSLNTRTRPIDDTPEVREVLDALDKRCKDIPSLKETVLDLKVYSDVDLSDDLIKRMLEYGWVINVTKKEVPKEVWVCVAWHPL